MSKRGVLSSKFNMSLGFIPVIVSIILCEFITQDISIYIGAGVGPFIVYIPYGEKEQESPTSYFIALPECSCF